MYLLFSITEEYSWFQYFTALLFFLIGIFAYPVRKIPLAYRILIILIASFLAADEMFMIHEYLKITVFKGLHSEFLRDIPILIYGIGGAIFFILLIPYLVWNRFSLIFFLLLLTSVGLILSTDVWGLFKGKKAIFIEEIAEAATGIFVCLYFWSQKNFQTREVPHR